jgi:hypothetical protein
MSKEAQALTVTCGGWTRNPNPVVWIDGHPVLSPHTITEDDIGKMVTPTPPLGTVYRWKPLST